MRKRTLFFFVSLPLLVACPGEQREEAVTEQAPAVEIVQPADGDTVSDDSLVVQLSATGITIAPAQGEAVPGEAHHHLFLDTDLTPAGEPIPKDSAGIYHMGTGASSLTLENLTSGRHRLIAVLALGDHVPLDPWAVDTVHFTVVRDTLSTAS